MTSPISSGTLVLALVVTFGCSGSDIRSSGVPATTLVQSRDDYHLGMAALVEGDYVKSFEALQRAARGPSYVVYSALARLRMADALFYQEKYEEAAEAYRAFLDTSAADPNVHYAYFRMAESKVRSIAGDFFLMPPDDRRDQKRVRSALSTLNDFVARYPDSPFIDEALAIRTRMTSTVASFEREVARFYMTRKRPMGAAYRIKRLMEDVPTTFRDEEVHVDLVEALAKAGDVDWLGRQCETYREVFPAGKQRSRVSKLCGSVATVAAVQDREL